MHTVRNHHRPVLSGIILLLIVLLGGCSDDTTGPDPSGNNPADTASVLLTFDIRTIAGTRPFALDSTYISEAGVEYKVSKFMYYVYGITLIDTAGNNVAAALVDTDNQPLKYNTTLVDYRRPETLTLRVLAPRGSYTAVHLTVGIPQFDAEGNMLNHVDASTMEYPLNVDTDMYWGWKVGYVFLKIEGTAMDGKGEPLPFLYHVGDDPRLMMMHMEMPFTVKGDGSSIRTLEVNVNRLFVTPLGGNSPNLAGVMEERVVHGGATADIVSANASLSGFMTLK